MASTRTQIPDRIVPMRVIVAGLHRTGTSSMRTALWQLGFYDCYHMTTVIQNIATHGKAWTDIFQTKYVDHQPVEKKDFDKVLGKSQSCVDLPTAVFSVELAQMFPDAKVIILTRDAESWYESALETIHASSKPPSVWAAVQMMFCYLFDSDTRAWVTFLKSLLALTTPFDHEREKDKAIAWYHERYREFRENIPKERQFEFKVQDGWEPLCKFLEVDVPTVQDPTTGKMVPAPFPHVNDRVMFHENIKLGRKAAGVRAKKNFFAVVGKLSVTAVLGYGLYRACNTGLGGVL